MRKIQTVPFWFIKSSILFYVALPASPVTAQIAPDATLPTNSNVTLEGNEAVITEGTKAGSNLFHSFEQFSVPTGGTAYFNNALDIQNIFSRVTGSSVSNIDGLLRANGTANLFLLNPNGIIFGPNARLNIGGSFLGSTATNLNFADGEEFSATSPQTTPLLTISRPVGLEFGSHSGRVLVQGVGAGRDPNSGLLLNREAGLSVQPSATLALLGNGVALEGGILSTEGGRLELGSVTNPSLIRITPIDKGWALDYSDAQNFRDIQLSQQAAVDASGLGSGSVQVVGRQIALTNGSQIESSTVGSQPGGTLSVSASESVELVGRSANNQFSSAIGTSVYPRATGNAGILTIETGQLSIRDGAQIGSVTAGIGSAGILSIKAKESVELVGTSSDGRFPTSLSTSSRPGATGNGGGLTLKTGRLNVRDGAQIQASTFGTGSAGSLTIKAEAVELIGTTADGRFPTATVTTSQRGATGNGGDLTLKTGRLSIQGGAQLGTATAGSGAAGTLKVEAKESVELDGTSANGRPSALSTRTIGAGNAGNLSIKTGYLAVQDGAAVTVSSEGTGRAGDLEVIADFILLDDAGKFTATSVSGSGGNIRLQDLNLLLLRDQSEISTNARGAGNGGNINIDTDVLVGLENSDITATAIEGRGGNIQINTQGIFGIEPRSERTPQSDITASSDLGVDGVVEINRPEVEPGQALTNLPEQPIDVSALIAQGCSGSGGNVARGTGKFIITGRGGLPLQAGEPLQAEAIVVSNDTLEAVKEQRSALVNTMPPQLVEAQGWVFNDQGKVVLTAQPPDATPDSSSSTVATCYAP